MTRHRTFVATALFVMSSPAVASATTYQVGPARAHKQLMTVAPLLKPGDRVEVDGGATYQGGVVFDKAGTPASPITIVGVAVGGKRPVVSGGTNTVEARANHYVFENLDITAGSFRCFFMHADGITLRDSVVHDCAQHGILGADTDAGSFLLERSEVHHCGSGTQNHQIYMSSDEVVYPAAVFRMQSSYVHDGNGGNNVKSRAGRNELYGNWIEGALYHEVELIGSETSPEGAVREDSDVVGNVLVKKNAFFVTRFGGDGTGQTNGRYRFVNNTVVTNGGSAVFRLMDGIESLEFHNNAFVAKSGNVALVDESSAAWVGGTSVIVGSHNWLQTGATKVPAGLANTVMGSNGNLFASLANGDLRPASGSSLVDVGGASLAGPSGKPFPGPLAVPNLHPPLGAPPATTTGRTLVGVIDIGAYELGGAAPAPPGTTPGTPPPLPPTSGSDAGAPGTGESAGSGAAASGGSTGAAGATESGKSGGTQNRAGANDVGGVPPLADDVGGCAITRRAPTRDAGALVLLVLAITAAVTRRRR